MLIWAVISFHAAYYFLACLVGGALSSLQEPQSFEHAPFKVIGDWTQSTQHATENGWVKTHGYRQPLLANG